VFLSPAQAGTIAKQARQLLRRGQLTHRELAILDALLWSCRAPGKSTCRVSYTRLCSLAHVCRECTATIRMGGRDNRDEVCDHA
jgi:hypothetical protein